MIGKGVRGFCGCYDFASKMQIEAKFSIVLHSFTTA
nr:MAG TPA: hypothetical protein [Bacteriophage sp.]